VMKTSELREKTLEELEVQLKSLYKDQFNWRMQQASGQLSKVHLMKSVRQNISRVKTIITDKHEAGV